MFILYVLFYILLFYITFSYLKSVGKMWEGVASSHMTGETHARASCFQLHVLCVARGSLLLRLNSEAIFTF